MKGIRAWSIQGSGWKESLEQLGFQKFATRVEQNSGQVYDETISWFRLAAPGGVLLLTGGPAAIMDFVTSRMSLRFYLLVVLVGLLLFVPGLAKWLLLRGMHDFSGISRKNLTMTLTWLDLKVQGVKNPGQITDKRCPPEYAGLGLQDFYGNAIRYAVLRSITKLGSVVPWPIEDPRRIGRRLSSAEAAMAVAGMCDFVVCAPAGYFEMILGGNPRGWLFFVLAVPGLVVGLWGIVRWARTKSSRPPWLRGTMLSDSVQPIDSMKGFLGLLAARYRSPLRVLVLGEYPELVRTGRMYRTTKGLELNEAVFIPRQ